MPLQVAPIPFFQLQKGAAFSARRPRVVPASITLFGGFNEFYCTAGGSNLNSGSDENNTAYYTCVNSNWDQTNLIYTPTDGSNPATSGVARGKFVAVFLDAASVTPCILRVKTVENAVNGRIFMDSSGGFMGTSPTTGATGRSIRAGGAWRGPNGSVRFPFDGTLSLASLTNLAGQWPCVNMKNDQTYSITAGLSHVGSNSAVSGYTSTPRDGGKATIDGGTSAITLFTLNSSNTYLSNLILSNNGTTGSNPALQTSSQAGFLYRIVAHDIRGFGFDIGNSSNTLIECEAYNCNRSNTASTAGFKVTSQCNYIYCVAHHNLGTNTDGFFIVTSATTITMIGCIVAENGRCGLAGEPAASGPLMISHCDFYANASDAIRNTATTASSFWVIRNCNFIANLGRAFNGASLTTGRVSGYMLNCGFGNGTQSNKGGKFRGTDMMVLSGEVNYTEDTTPYRDPEDGRFDIILPEAMNAGAGTFTITQGGYGPTVGFPDIGAAQAQALTSALNASETTLRDGYVNHEYYVLAEYETEFTIEVSAGSLPSGISLSQPTSTSFLLSGTPTLVGEYSATMLITAPDSSTGTFIFNIEVFDDPDEGVGGMILG